MSNNLMKIDSVAQLLQISKRTVHRLNCTAKIPSPVKINGSIRWRESDIDLWLDLGCPDRETFNVRKAS